MLINDLYFYFFLYLSNLLFILVTLVTNWAQKRMKLNRNKPTVNLIGTLLNRLTIEDLLYNKKIRNIFTSNLRKT